MSINNSYRIQIIESDGETTRYNFKCFIYKKEDLKIKVMDGKANITELQYGNDYNVESSFDYYNGGYFNLAEPQKKGMLMVIYRETPIDQQINFLSLQAISPMNLTKMFDKLTIICQELNEQFYRSMKFDFTDISIIDQDKPLDETNIKNIDKEINNEYIVALTLKYNETTQKWELATSRTNPDEKREQGTEDIYGIYKIATQEEVKVGEDDTKVITPLKLFTELNDRQATDQEIENGEDVKKYVNPKQLKALNNNVNNIEDTTNYILQDGIAGWLDTFEYKKFSIVTYVEDDIVNLYYSLQENNKGHLPTEKDFWEKIVFGNFAQEILNNIERQLIELNEELIKQKEEVNNTITDILNNIPRGVPSKDLFIDFEIKDSGDTSYIAPEDGWYYLRGNLASTAANVNSFVQCVLINGADETRYQRASGSSLQGQFQLLFPVQKGDNIRIDYTAGTIFESARFYSMSKGVVLPELEPDPEPEPTPDPETPPTNEGEDETETD